MTPNQLADQIEQGVIGPDGLALIRSERRLIVWALRNYNPSTPLSEATPRTDAMQMDTANGYPEFLRFARVLERELNDARLERVASRLMPSIDACIRVRDELQNDGTAKWHGAQRCVMALRALMDE